MERVSAELSGVGRAQWLAELSEALEQAHALMWKLGIGDGGGPAAVELYLRVEAARLEVQALRLGGGVIPLRYRVRNSAKRTQKPPPKRPPRHASGWSVAGCCSVSGGS